MINQIESELSISEKLENILKNPGINEIIEWTFMYDKDSKKEKTPYNTTFFQNIGGVSYEDLKSGKINPEDLINKTSEKLNLNIEKLILIKEELKNNQNTQNKQKLDIEIEGIDYIIISLQTALYSIPIELEKSGLYNMSSSEEREKYNELVSEGQILLYGPKISENPEEIEMTLKLMCEEYSIGKKYLSQEEQKFYINLYNNLISKLEDKANNIEVPDIKIYEIKETEKIEQDDFTKNTLEKCKQIKISKENYIKIWQLYIDSMGLKQKVIENPNASSIYDGANFLEIPSSKKYDELYLNEVLELMLHEIGAHYVNQATSEKSNFQIRGAKNVIKEEGLAIIMEDLFKGNKIKDIKGAGYSYPFMIIGELFSKEERQKFIDLRFKMDSKGIDIDIDKNRDLRLMRGFSLDSNYTQKKDCAYGRGKNEIINIISQGKFSIVDFYKGKFSIEDTINGKLDGVIKNDDILYPLLFPDLILFMIGKGRKELNHTNFINYLKEKYKGDIPDKYFDQINIISIFSRMKFMRIMKILPDFL